MSHQFSIAVLDLQAYNKRLRTIIVIDCYPLDDFPRLEAGSVTCVTETSVRTSRNSADLRLNQYDVGIGRYVQNVLTNGVSVPPAFLSTGFVMVAFFC